MSTDLGLFELLVLMAVGASGDEAYGLVIRREVAASRGSEVSSGAIYTTLERLERRNLVASRRGGANSARGGRPRRYYRVTRAGQSAIQSNCAAVRRLAARVPAKATRA